MGNGRRPALHHPIPGNMWTEGLSIADQMQKKKNSSRGQGHDVLVTDLLTFVGLLKFSVGNSGVMSAS